MSDPFLRFLVFSLVKDFDLPDINQLLQDIDYDLPDIYQLLQLHFHKRLIFVQENIF